MMCDSWGEPFGILPESGNYYNKIYGSMFGFEFGRPAHWGMIEECRATTRNMISNDGGTFYKGRLQLEKFNLFHL